MSDANHPGAAVPSAIPFGAACRFWLKLGFISFGGPAGQIAMLHKELVDERRWISERRFLHALNYCMLLPGPEAQQMAIYMGWLMHRTLGGLVAGTLFVLPSWFMLCALSGVYLVWGQLPLVAGLFYGIKPAVVAIVLHALYRIGSRTLGPLRRNRLMWGLALGSFVAVSVLQLSFPLIVAVAAGAGWVAARRPLATPATDAPRQRPPATRAVIDDDTPTPAHARYTPRRLLTVLGVGIGLWALSLAALLLLYGVHGLLPQMAWFFTKAALLTFGGAYAVLPYVVQGAVHQFAWLNAAQMMDGLALGETTPGPLIMVVAFVGFLGAWGAPPPMAGSALLAGLLGAAVATWFTFLPSFVFILAGGPWVESTHGQLRLQGPLKAITAAVVGVMAALTGFFFVQVVLRPGVGLDGFALGVCTLAVLALFRYKIGVIPVIAACALFGLVARLGGLA